MSTPVSATTYNRALVLEHEAMAVREVDQQRREAAFEDKKADLDNALASFQRVLTAMEARHEAQSQDAARSLADAQAEVQALKRSLAAAEDHDGRTRGHSSRRDQRQAHGAGC